jgi:hypothetical protein
LLQVLSIDVILQEKPHTFVIDTYPYYQMKSMPKKYVDQSGLCVIAIE